MALATTATRAGFDVLHQASRQAAHGLVVRDAQAGGLSAEPRGCRPILWPTTDGLPGQPGKPTHPAARSGPRGHATRPFERMFENGRRGDYGDGTGLALVTHVPAPTEGRPSWRGPLARRPPARRPARSPSSPTARPTRRGSRRVSR